MSVKVRLGQVRLGRLPTSRGMFAVSDEMGSIPIAEAC